MTDYNELMLELDDMANKERNRVGRNPASDLMWEASRAIGELLEKTAPPAPKPKGRPPKAAS